MNAIIKTLSTAILAGLVAAACEDLSPLRVPPGKIAPDEPSQPSPSNRALGQYVNVDLEWRCIDRDSDSLWFSVHFGTDTLPPLLDSNWAAAAYALDDLRFDSTYYWRINARDEDGNRREGPLWRFSVMSDAAVQFSDPALAGVVRSAIGKMTGDMHVSDLYRLEVLSATHLEINSLGGMNYLTGLKSLALNDNKIRELDPLAPLKTLSYIYLADNLITNLAPLGQIDSLVSLDLSGNRVSDFDPLTALPALAALEYSGAEFLDGHAFSLPSISRIQSLKHLGLTSDNLTDIGYLSDLTRLETLILQNNEISDLRPLQELTGLKILDLSLNHVTNVEDLDGLTGLESLALALNDVQDIRPLEALVNLRMLDLTATSVRNIGPLAGLIHVERLALSGLELTDLGPLADMTAMGELSAASNQIRDISALRGMVALQELQLQDNRISDIGVLKFLRELRLVLLADNRISDIFPLVDNPGLGEGDYVNLTGNPLSAESVGIYIPQLEARGVRVEY